MLPGTGRAADWHAPRWAAAVLHLWAAHVQHCRARQRHERRPPSITASGMLFVRPALQSPGPRCTTILHASGHAWEATLVRLFSFVSCMLTRLAEHTFMHRDCWCSKHSRSSRRRRRSRQHRSSHSRTRRRWGICSR